MEADAQFLRGSNLIIDAAAVRVEVEVVTRCGAATEQQLGQADFRGNKYSVSVHPCPDWVQCCQPTKQPAVLSQATSQGLIQVMVCVDQSREHDHTAGIDDAIRIGW